MTVRLRGHHLLCLLTYAGKGYSPAFTAGFTALAKRIEAGEAVMVVDGPDDICIPVLNAPNSHCHNRGISIRDMRANRDVGMLLSRKIGPGAVLKLDSARISRMRKSFADQTIRSACIGCEWAGLCDQIADDGYKGTVVGAGSR